MKAKMKSLAVAVALVASGAANAAIDSPQTANGELFLSIWDSTAGNEASFNFGLNINVNTFDGNGSYTFTNIFSDPVFTANFDAGNFSTQSNWLWNVVGGNTLPSDGESSMFTSISDNVQINNTAARTGAANIQSYLLPLGSCDSCGVNGNPGDPRYAGGPNFGNTLGGLPINNAGRVGDELFFYYALNETLATDYEASPIGPAQMTLFAGTWLLDADGTLTYNALGAPVPVPAAVWLLGSALIGLVGVARRREALTEALAA